MKTLNNSTPNPMNVILAKQKRQVNRKKQTRSTFLACKQWANERIKAIKKRKDLTPKVKERIILGYQNNISSIKGI